MANRMSGHSANRISWIDGRNMISMESLAPSLEPEPEEPEEPDVPEEPEEPTPPKRIYANSSLTALPAAPSIPNSINSILRERREQVRTSILASTPKPPPPRTIHGIKWGVAGENIVSSSTDSDVCLTINPVVAILSSVFLFSLDQTIVADVQPAIVGHFGEVAKLPWLSVSLLLGAASTNLFW